MGARFANEIIVISNVINDMLIRKYHRKEGHMIYNGVPAPQIVDFPEYLEETGVEKGKYIFSMCRFVPEKNLHHLIEAFSKTDNKGCRLVLAGDTDFEDEYSAGLKKYAREQGVVLTGFIPSHPRPLLRAALFARRASDRIAGSDELQTARHRKRHSGQSGGRS